MLNLGVNISVMPAPIPDVVSNEKSNSICHAVRFSKNMLNRHHDEKTEKVPYIIEDRMSIQPLCPIPDLANNNSRIILKKIFPARSSYFMQMIPVQVALSSASRIDGSKRCDPS